MDNIRNTVQSGPWYREPWPWILMSGPCVVVIAGFVTLYLAVARIDPLVVDNYYKEGLAINRMLARDRVAAQKGYRASVLVNGEHTRVRVQLAGKDLPAELRLHFVHPTKAGMDVEVTAKQIQLGWYDAAFKLAQALRWNVQLEDPGQTWRLTGDWYSGDDIFVLEPRRE